MQGVQRRFGEDRVQVLLVSVDLGYGPALEVVGKNRKVLDRLQLPWPNALLRGGWDGAIREFNVSGYQSVVVDAEGIVRSANVLATQLEQTVAPLLEKSAGDGGEEGRSP